MRELSPKNPPLGGEFGDSNGGAGGDGPPGGDGLPGGDAGVVEIVDGSVTWRVDEDFMRSNWTCIWGRGCQGILDEPAEHLNQGCCSVGAELSDVNEAMRLSAYAALVPDSMFQHLDVAGRDGIFSDETKTNTRIVDGACIFLNRPDFGDQPGCALHLGALDCGDSPTEWKPSVCWQLPVRVDWAPDGEGETATLRRWSRADWGDDGDTMAWMCTEEPASYVGDEPVLDSLGEEIEAIVGSTVYVELRRRLGLGRS